MFDFHEKRKIRSILYSKIVVGLLFMGAALLSVSVYNRYTVAEDMKAKLDARYTELEQLKSRAAVLESKVQYLEDERGIEEELRNRFDVAKEGEQVIILVDEKNKDQERDRSMPNTATPDEPESVFHFLKFWE